MASSITFSVDGKAHTVSVVPETPLLYVLRNDLELNGAKFGCGLAQCGACTVIANGAARATGARIRDLPPLPERVKAALS